MATFNVTNLNPAFPHTDGFWFTNQSDGGVNTQGTVDPADDTVTAPTSTKGSDQRGTWVWCNGQDFEIDGDATDPRSNAGMLLAGLGQEEFVWLPNNPAYNTVAPLLKDGVTENPDFDNALNPLLMEDSVLAIGDVTRAQRTGDVCQHFAVSVDGTPVVFAEVAEVEDEEEDTE